MIYIHIYAAIAAIVATYFIIVEWDDVKAEGMLPDLIILGAVVGALWPAWLVLVGYVAWTKWEVK